MTDAPGRTSTRDGAGAGYVGLAGIIALGVYLLGGAWLTTYSLITLWPADLTSAAGRTPYLGFQIEHTAQQQTILLVLFSGALGSLVHALRSFFWYVGNRELKWSWVPMYVMLPFTGALLGLVFYIVLIAGLFAGAPAGDAKTAGFAAIAALVGMFSGPAAEKLQQVFETIFTRRPQGIDTVTAVVDTAAPVVKNVNITRAGAKQTLSVEGTDFREPLTVNVSNSAGVVTPVTATHVSTTTFAADVALAPGEWTMTVAGKDGKASQPAKFTV